MADKIKLGLAVLLVIAGIAGFYLLKDSALILRVASVLAGLVAAALVAWTTAPGRVFFVFAQESVVETKKVVWPSRKETVCGARLFGLREKRSACPGRAHCPRRNGRPVWPDSGSGRRSG